MNIITPLYLDTSAAFKLILPEEKGADNAKIFLENKKPYGFVSSTLLQLELHSIIRRITKTPPFEYDAPYLGRLANDLILKIFLKPLTEKVIQEAIITIQNSGIINRLRSLDALHFSTFLIFCEIFPNIILMTSDRSLVQLAEEKKAQVFNPEEAY